MPQTQPVSTGNRVSVDDLAAFIVDLSEKRGGLLGVLVIPVTFRMFTLADGESKMLEATSFVVLW